jgi:uncharacterized protein
MSTSAAEAPVAREARIDAIDTLRGVALLGILLINIVPLGLPHNGADDPTVAGGDTGWNLAAWALGSILFEGKMRTLFSMLFGAGVVLLTSRIDARGGSGADVHTRRNLWLMAFGLVDAYLLLWPGDVLFPYGLCALFLYPFRNLSPRTLLISGLLLLALLIPQSAMNAREMETARAAAARAEAKAAKGGALTDEEKEAKEKWAETESETKPDAEALEKEIATRRSSYGEIFASFHPIIARIQSSGLYRGGFFDVTGMMLIGMGLMKLGVFTAALPPRVYGAMALLGYTIGLPLAFWSAALSLGSGFDPVTLTSIGATYDVTRLAVALGHAGVVMLVCGAGILRRTRAALANVGRMALTNYVLQTLLATLVFNGYGLGLFARLERHELYGVVAAIWAFELALSTLFLARFRYGPLEWAWRSLTYWRRQPMRLEHTPRLGGCPGNALDRTAGG